MESAQIFGGDGGPMLAVTALDASMTGPEAEELGRSLRNRIVGQDEAIQHIVGAYQSYLAGLSPVGRPVANFHKRQLCEL